MMKLRGIFDLFSMLGSIHSLAMMGINALYLSFVELILSGVKDKNVSHTVVNKLRFLPAPPYLLTYKA